jgi:hypothetical protein
LNVEVSLSGDIGVNMTSIAALDVLVDCGGCKINLLNIQKIIFKCEGRKREEKELSHCYERQFGYNRLI